MIAKNGIDWKSLGYTVYGECPKYGSTKHKRHNISKDSKKNISFLPSYKLWCRLIQMDRGNLYPKIILCEKWKEYEYFEKWYNENYYDVKTEQMNFTYSFFDVNNTYVSPETGCFLPNSINKINKRNCMFIELVNKYKSVMPDNVRLHCEELCEVLNNGKVE